MANIFLSYRSIQADFALKLAADLKNAGVKLWMDRLDAGIRVGDDWVQALQDALDQCAAVVAVLSPDYVSSKYCRRELKRADAFGKPIFPVLLYTLQKEEWPFEIQEKHYIDFRDWRDQHAYCERLDKLVDALGRRFPEHLRAVPDAETRYLTSLIADLELQKGVLEYVEIAAQAEAQDMRPRPGPAQEWAPGFSILTEVVTSTAASGSRQRRVQKTGLETVQQALELYPRFVLLGAPGSGKTTTLRKLALDVARKRLTAPRSAPLPLFLSLPTWPENQSIDGFIRAVWPFESDPEGPLRRGEAALYLDGLNEMGAQGGQHARLLRDWLRDNSAQYVIVTCRASDYGGNLDLCLPQVFMEELDEPRIGRFCQNYLETDKATAFLAHIDEDRATAEYAVPILGFWWSEEQKASMERAYERDKARNLHNLAKNPYLLTALIFVFGHSPTLDLPRNSGKLFQALARALWARERERRIRGWIPFQEMEAALGRLAFAMIDEGKPLEVPLEYALEKAGHEDLLRSAHSASLVEIHGDTLRFYHQLVQDYLAGAQLGRVGVRKSLEKPDLYWHTKRGRVAGKWDQAIIALSGITEDADRVVREVPTVNPLLAADCIASGAVVSAETRRHTRGQIVHQISTHGHCMIWAGMVSLGDLADAETIPLLLGILRENEGRIIAWSYDGYHERPGKVFDTVESVLDTLGEAAVPGLIEALHRPRREGLGEMEGAIESVAVRALRKIGTPEALVAVQQWQQEQKT